jgi:hypothetical protein
LLNHSAIIASADADQLVRLNIRCASLPVIKSIGQTPGVLRHACRPMALAAMQQYVRALLP